MGKLDITRRDFLNGIALGVAAGGTLSPLELLARDGRYPPALTGMRGDHEGSFETSHALAWGGLTWPRPDDQVDDTYDLVVVGGGLSGLGAAFLYQQRIGQDANVLILENHDDFGGHATRNEFTVDGTHLIGYGGNQSIDTPSEYSKESAQLLKDIGIFTERFYDYYDQDYFTERGLGSGIWFSSEEYGQDRTLPDVLGTFGRGANAEAAAAIDRYPISDAGKSALKRLLGEERDYLGDMSRDKKIDYLRRLSYTDYLQQHAGMPKDVTDILRDNIRGLWAVGWDSLSALEGFRLGMPATDGLGLGQLDDGTDYSDEPYIFHFPDGCAGVARSLVRQLVPEAVPGSTMEDLVLSRVNYDLLDVPGAPNRIRLDSTAVDVRHTADEKHVDITYVRQGSTERVRAKHVVLACYHRMIPHICDEVPESQREAIDASVRAPLVYINIAVRNWRAFAELGFNSLRIPKPRLMHSFVMDFPVSMGNYEYTQSPDEPAVIHGTFVPAYPDEGMTAREQYLKGRREIFTMTYADFERRIVRQMSGALEPGGFDADRDIAAITVNRWPHGYAYEYNELFDPPDFGPDKGPHIAGRAQIGRISIANSDASAFAYADGAFDAAHRAVSEQLAL